jgi:hypothetical protein
MTLLLTYWLLSGLILAVCLFALWKGDDGVRWGAALILGMILIERIGVLILKPSIALIPLISMGGNGLTAMALLALVMRYASPWIGGMMLFYALQFAIHAFYFVTHRPPDAFRFFAINACFIAVNVCLLGGAVAAWRDRRAAASLAPR